MAIIWKIYYEVLFNQKIDEFATDFATELKNKTLTIIISDN